MIPQALTHSVFRNYLAGNFFGLNGMWILRIVAGWLAWDLTGSAALTGLVAFLNFAPTIVSGPFFGVVADRVDPRHGIILTQTLQLLLGVVLFGMAMMGAVTVPALLAISLGIGMAASAYHPMRMALAPRLVPAEVLPQAVAMTALNFNTTRMLGPALGGWMIAAYGVETAAGVAAALYIPQILAFIIMPAHPPAKPEREGPGGLRGMFEDLSEGARYAWDRPLIRDAILLTAISAVPARGALELLPAAADGLYGRGAGGFGILTAAAGAGAVVSAIWMARGRASAETMRRRALVCAALGLALVVALGLIHSWPVAVAAVTGMGFLGTVVGVSCQTVVQVLTPDGRRGRVMSMWLLMAIGGTSLGAIGIGALADAVGLRPALIGAGAVTMLALGWLAVRPVEAEAGP